MMAACTRVQSFWNVAAQGPHSVWPAPGRDGRPIRAHSLGACLRSALGTYARCARVDGAPERGFDHHRYGSRRPRGLLRRPQAHTPTLDALACEGVLFRTAVHRFH